MLKGEGKMSIVLLCTPKLYPPNPERLLQELLPFSLIWVLAWLGL